MSASHPVDHSVGLCVNFEVGRSEQIGHSEAFVGNLLVPNMRPNWLKGRIINSFAHSNHHSRSSNEWPGKVDIDFIEFQPLPQNKKKTKKKQKKNRKQKKKLNKNQQQQ